jgi:hypothetical protein
VPLAFEGAGAVFRFAQAAHSGIYEARLGDFFQRFAVNLDTNESDLTRLNAEHLRSLLTQNKTDEQAVAATGTSAPFFRWLLAAVLALLVAEPCVAWSFARRRG